MSNDIIIPGEQVEVFELKQGSSITITDLEGQQVVDLLAFKKDNLKEYLSMSHSRLGLRKMNFGKGDVLLTNLLNPIIEFTEDTVGTHDSMIASCNPGMYEELGVPGHPSCHENFTKALKDYNIEPWWQPDPLNLFQNTPMLADGSFKVGTPPSKSGDYVTLTFLEDTLLALSVCPFTMEGFNAGKSTPIQVTFHS